MNQTSSRLKSFVLLEVESNYFFNRQNYHCHNCNRMNTGKCTNYQMNTNEYYHCNYYCNYHYYVKLQLQLQLLLHDPSQLQQMMNQ
ncbi:hypothetical protein RclHR1_00040009 [Rhizophagus clarus]|uniref:Uncharacterized protein n=1 Tax=Rhizophagus clarus TaxID=94130 RepID=A0A2Z6RE29_9GLOM|nr:hypothetical protein RclHR1_00040009 [Rhizophagus clarus]